MYQKHALKETDGREFRIDDLNYYVGVLEILAANVNSEDINAVFRYREMLIGFSAELQHFNEAVHASAYATELPSDSSPRLNAIDYISARKILLCPEWAVYRKIEFLRQKYGFVP